MLGLRGENALAEGVALFPLPPGKDVLEAEYEAFCLFGLRTAEVGDGGYDLSQEPDSLAEVVLDDLFDGDDPEGGLDARSPKAVGDKIVHDDLANGA